MEHINPDEIEKRSFEIITKELEGRDVLINGSTPVDENDTSLLAVIKRCIHTTADFDYATSMCFSEGAIEKLKELIEKGATVVTDTNMALSGINKKKLERYGCKAYCFMADEKIAAIAEENGCTRASAAMEHAMTLCGPVIFVIGNAPTALMTLREHFDKGRYTPAFIIGVPVGFVNVVAAKELILETPIPYIINAGRKGGSNVAAAIVNAILKDMP